MPSITVRDVPAQTRDQLAARSAACGQSLQEYLRETLIAHANRPDARVLMAEVRDRKLTTGTKLSTSRILKHRDEDRT